MPGVGFEPPTSAKLEILCFRPDFSRQEHAIVTILYIIGISSSRSIIWHPDIPYSPNPPKIHGKVWEPKTHIFGLSTLTNNHIDSKPKQPNSPRHVDTFWPLTCPITHFQTPEKNTWEGIGNDLCHAPTVEPSITIWPHPQKAHAVVNTYALKKTASKNTYPSGLCTFPLRTDGRTDGQTDRRTDGRTDRVARIIRAEKKNFFSKFFFCIFGFPVPQNVFLAQN